MKLCATKILAASKLLQNLTYYSISNGNKKAFTPHWLRERSKKHKEADMNVDYKHQRQAS